MKVLCRYHAAPRPGATGFTLTELLVSIAIFTSVMAGITLVFIGATRTSQQGFQNQEAFEIARGAMNLMQRDLSRAFTARQRGDIENFYGTPIGFSFIGVASPRTDENANVARITYVMVLRTGAEIFTTTDADDNDIQKPIYDLVRFVEPGVEDLDSFPVDWNMGLDGFFGAATLQQLVDNEVALRQAPTPPAQPPCVGDPECLRVLELGVRRELWIRMLSRMEVPQIPDIWPTFNGGAGLDPMDYVLAENVWDEYIQNAGNIPVTPGMKIFQTARPPDPPPALPLPAPPVPPYFTLEYYDPVDPLYTRSDTIPFFWYQARTEQNLNLTGEVENATNASPIVILSPDHGLTTNTIVAVSGVRGTIEPPTPPLPVDSAANGVWLINVPDPNTFELFDPPPLPLAPSVGDADFAGGGRWVVEREITDASTATPIVITDIGHGLSLGNVISISGVRGNTNANGIRAVTPLDVNTFAIADANTLVDIPANGAYSDGGTWVKAGRIGNIDNLATPLRVTDANHGLATGNRIRVSGVQGTTSANGIFEVLVIDIDNFDLVGSVPGLPYVANTGMWVEEGSETIEQVVSFWNDTRNIGNGAGSPFTPELPQLVHTKFTLFFPSPTPGAPDFERTFEQDIDIPAGYRRYTNAR